MHKPKKSKCRVAGLVIAGLVSVFFGLSQIIGPVPYVSTGGIGQFAGIKVVSVFTGNDARFMGELDVAKVVSRLNPRRYVNG